MIASNFKRIAIFAVIAMAFVLLPSIPQIRNLLALPLVVTDPNAKGEACYVLAGGSSILERLDAAADLIQMGRVNRILLMQDTMRGQYSFKTNSSWTRAQWMLDYLAWRGIPKERIIWFPQTEGTFGTLTEARTVAGHFPKNVKTLLIVSSAPHMRRSVLAFRRSLPADVKVIPYAATTFENSHERYHPVWLEYLKLLVYFVVA